MSLARKIVNLQSRGMSYVAIAQRLGTNKNTVASKLFKARRPRPETPKPRLPMPPRVLDIVNRMAREADIDPADIVSGDRSRDLCIVRHEIMREIRDTLTMSDGKPPSYPQIGRWFGRNHATVMDGISRARRRKVDA